MLSHLPLWRWCKLSVPVDSEAAHVPGWPVWLCPDVPPQGRNADADGTANHGATGIGLGLWPTMHQAWRHGLAAHCDWSPWRIPFATFGWFRLGLAGSPTSVWADCPSRHRSQHHVLQGVQQHGEPVWDGPNWMCIKWGHAPYAAPSLGHLWCPLERVGEQPPCLCHLRAPQLWWPTSGLVGSVLWWGSSGQDRRKHGHDCWMFWAQHWMGLWWSWAPTCLPGTSTWWDARWSLHQPWLPAVEPNAKPCGSNWVSAAGALQQTSSTPQGAPEVRGPDLHGAGGQCPTCSHRATWTCSQLEDHRTQGSSGLLHDLPPVHVWQLLP